jgi:hypothetical protein
VTASATVYVGAAQPEALTITVASSASLPDLTVVSAASIHVTRPSGSTTWTPTISAQSAGSLTLLHVFALDGSDVTAAGNYVLCIYLTTPSGVRRCGPVTMYARALT